jgi:hypothetical protein
VLSGKLGFFHIRLRASDDTINISFLETHSQNDNPNRLNTCDRNNPIDTCTANASDCLSNTIEASTRMRRGIGHTLFMRSYAYSVLVVFHCHEKVQVKDLGGDGWNRVRGLR